MTADMDDTLANALRDTLGIQRPNTTEQAVELLEGLQPELVRLRRIAAVVESIFGRSFANAHDAEAALVQMKSFHDLQSNTPRPGRSRW